MLEHLTFCHTLAIPGAYDWHAADICDSSFPLCRSICLGILIDTLPTKYPSPSHLPVSQVCLAVRALHIQDTADGRITCAMYVTH